MFIKIEQSHRSVKPPWPGIQFAKSLIFRARFKPEAKNPPKGPIRLANSARTITWIWNSVKVKAGGSTPKSPKGAAKKFRFSGYSYVKIGSVTQSLSKANILNVRWCCGQVNHWYWVKYLAQKAAVIVVPTMPPKNPSQVLLGESLIRGVLPKVIPNK